MKFSEILFSKCLSTKENATKKLFWHFWAFFWQKKPKLPKNEENCQNFQTVGLNFLKFGTFVTS